MSIRVNEKVITGEISTGTIYVERIDQDTYAVGIPCVNTFTNEPDHTFEMFSSLRKANEFATRIYKERS